MYKKLFSCRNKVAVVTGGYGLIGKEITRTLSDFGAKVYVADIDNKKAEGLTKRSNIKYICLDISSEDSVEKVMCHIAGKSGRIDILVNSAYPRTLDWNARFENVPFDSWKGSINSHLGGYFCCCRTAAEIMKKQKSGSIINLASIYGIVGPDFRIYEGTKMTVPAAYSAIKGGLITLTRYIAAYYAKYNIRANVISPGGIFNNQEKSFVKKYTQKTPLGRMGRPEDVVGAVIYLASDASRYVTGINLIVDGGWTAW